MTDSNRELPELIKQKVADMPEYSYGVNRITVILNDGTQVPDVYVAWSSKIIRVGVSEQLSFDPARIVDVRCQL